MIDSLGGLLEFLFNASNIKNLGNNQIRKELTYLRAEYFCPKCGDVRKCICECLMDNNRYECDKINGVTTPIPWLLKVVCSQCDSKSLLLIYEGANGTELAVLHDTYGGCMTPNTPPEIKYYIDQAYRARMVGATSAAATMYRSALEMLLYKEGFTDGMLKKKIDNLVSKKNDGTAPWWADKLNEEFLVAIKDIGNGSTHPNGGDIGKQLQIDNEILQTIDIIFEELLNLIYEQPLRSIRNLSRLKNVASDLS